MFSDPFHQLNDRQVQKRQAVYDQKMRAVQRIYTEQVVQSRDHQYSCDQEKSQYKCADQINIVEKSLCKDYRLVGFAVKSVYKSGGTKRTKRQSASQQASALV